MKQDVDTQNPLTRLSSALNRNIEIYKPLISLPIYRKTLINHYSNISVKFLGHYPWKQTTETTRAWNPNCPFSFYSSYSTSFLLLPSFLLHSSSSLLPLYLSSYLPPALPPFLIIVVFMPPVVGLGQHDTTTTLPRHGIKRQRQLQGNRWRRTAIVTVHKKISSGGLIPKRWRHLAWVAAMLG